MSCPNNNFTRTQIEKIALYLGKPWKVNHLKEPSAYWHQLIDGSGRALHFRVDDKKFSISGDFPRSRTLPQHQAHKSIGVTIGRPAQDIAADIKRRLLPHYLEAYETAKIRYQEEQATQERLTTIATLLARVTKGRVAEYGRGARTIYFDNGSAELWTRETVDLELRNLSIEQMIKIVSLLYPDAA